MATKELKRGKAKNRGRTPTASKASKASNAKLAAKSEPTAESFTVRVRHTIPDDVNLTYSDNIIVQHTPNEFTITFAQVQQPIALREEDYEHITNVQAKVVARIVLSPLKAMELIDTLQKNWAIFERRFKQLALTAKAEGEDNVSSITVPTAD